MNHKEQVQHFSNALDALIDRHCDEFDLTYASVIGVLTMKTHDLCVEVNTPDEEELKE